MRHIFVSTGAKLEYTPSGPKELPSNPPPTEPEQAKEIIDKILSLK